MDDAWDVGLSVGGVMLARSLVDGTERCMYLLICAYTHIRYLQTIVRCTEYSVFKTRDHESM